MALEEKRRGAGQDRRMRAIGVLVALLASALLAAVLLVPAGAAHAASSGSVELGIAVGKRVEAPEAGAKGTVSLGIAVGTNKVEQNSEETPTGGTVGIGIAAGHLPYHEVHFVEYYCDEAGNVLADTRGALAPAQQVAWGGHATDPLAAGSIEREGHWADAWYTADPLAHPDAEPVPLDQIEIKNGTMLFCLWKKGYVIQLDANNGTVEASAAKFAGVVEAPGSVSVARDVAFEEGDATERPAGVAYADFPEATRPGYEFKGWYWADGDKAPDSYGRVPLAETASDGTDAVVAAPGGDAGSGLVDGEMPYDFLREHSGKTLYAKWELAPGVRLALTDARDPDGKDVHLWYWPGRGYATERPGNDFEAAGTLYAGPGAMELAGFGQHVYGKPVPASKVFKGWGIRETGSGDLDGRLLVSCETVGGDGAASDDRYQLEEAAFAEGLWEDQMDALLDGDKDGWVETALAVVGSPVKISVDAPFRVTFDKGDDAENALPYTADELTYGDGTPRWIASREQQFTNYTGRPVYVSALECTEVGARALLPGGRNGDAVFALFDGELSGSGADVPARHILFGYAADSAGASYVATAPWVGATSNIVLDWPEGTSLADGHKQSLRYGLDLATARFDKAAMAVGNAGAEGDASRYAASLANVKYTYALVPGQS